MSSHSVGLSPELRSYLASNACEPEVLRALREETQRLPNAGMQISPEQGRFMRWLSRLIGAQRCLEIGVFTGYSSLSVALALPDEGRLVACDRSREWTDVARRYWGQAGVAAKIDLRLAPALQTLDQLVREGAEGTFDFAFVDADKEGYPEYYERCLVLLRQGGVALFDNAVWGGRVTDASAQDADTRAIRALNQKALSDPRVDASLVPIGDGLLLLRKVA